MTKKKGARKPTRRMSPSRPNPFAKVAQAVSGAPMGKAAPATGKQAGPSVKPPMPFTAKKKAHKKKPPMRMAG